MIPASGWANVFTGCCWLLAVAWLAKAADALFGMPSLIDLNRLDMNKLPALPEGARPHLTVIVPACNEEASIVATLQSLLGSTGLRLEIIAVNDRSTDRTGTLMDAVAAEAAAGGGAHVLRVIHVRELPAGWLGKPHALSLAVAQAAAPWLLFTDADVTFAPHALELALRYAEAEKADHLVLAPTLTRKSMGEAVVQATIQTLATWAVRLWKVADPKCKDAMGVGAFNLVRADVFRSLGGFEPLRMEVVEDMSTAWMMKRAGYRSRMTLGPGLVRIRWIEGVFGIVGNMEKNGFAVFRYNTVLAVVMCLGLAADVVVPLAAIAAGGWALPAGLLTYLGVALIMLANRRLNGISPLAALLFAPATAIVCFGFARSVVLTLARGGVRWRGTLYPLDELRRNAVSWR
jgi:glycosyltransferase involved in cell wall biosynthesis